jgi:putative heme-binding domain-containing protein
MASLLTGLAWIATPVQAQVGRGVPWIWFDEGDPASKAPAEQRYFRRTFSAPQVVDEATIDITADKQFTLWVNGALVGKGENPKRVFHFDIKKHLLAGNNVVAVEAKGSGGPSGLLVRMSYVPNGQSVVGISGDASWKTAKTAGAGWEKVDFDDGKWAAAKVLGPYGKAGPWKNLIWDAGGDDRFAVPPGFRVEKVINETYSLVNMCFDAKGRLLISEENGPVLLCTQPNKDGVFQLVRIYCDQVKNCQGMCWVNDALLLVGNGGPKGTTPGLYRCKENKAGDKIESVELLMSFRGGMGEHGPHAVIHGPDNSLYVVIGNHSWANINGLAENSPLKRWPSGAMGPDQGKPGTTEDVLLPRLNDANGHAANILAPGGTIWRMDPTGKHVGLFSAGYRNHFDAAINTFGEVFTFDSDMEWDEGLPWYRPVRISHVTPGSDFVWRTGAANTPDYYIDSLPPMYDTGRGSPVGLEFYEHTAFPAKYQGAYFMADWSLGLIWVALLERNGATYKAKVERFCQGAPMNVTDINVGPDGALYFVMGGRGSRGGVYRIVYPGKSQRGQDLVPQPQPLSAWSRAKLAVELKGLGNPTKVRERFLSTLKELKSPEAAKQADSAATLVRNRIQLLSLMQMHGVPPDVKLLQAELQDKNPEIRAHAVYLLGVNGYREGQDALVKALKDEDKLVQRRACEALIRAGFEPPVDALWPLLKDNDRFLRTAARLVLERIDPKKWTDRLWKEENNIVAYEGIVALCKTNHAAPYAEQIFTRLSKPAEGVEMQLAHIRTIQLALIHAGAKPQAPLQAIVSKSVELFPQKDKMVNRELAILLTYFRKEKLTDAPVHAKILADLLANKGDQQQQIHYFYCLRLLHEGWSADQKDALLAWVDTAKTWNAPGHSFRGFLKDIFRDLNPIFTAEDRARALAKVDQLPRVAGDLLMLAPPKDLPPVKTLLDLYEKVAQAKPAPWHNDTKTLIIFALGNCSNLAESQAALRKIADKEPAQRDTVALNLARVPSAENYPYLLQGLQSSNQVVLMNVIDGLKKSASKPKVDDPAPFRAALVASDKLNPKQRWAAVELLRHWNNRNFGADKPEQSKEELTAWTKWFAQSFPKEPPLPILVVDKPSESKYNFDELLAYLEKDPQGTKGDPKRGRLVFEKGQCIKCHKYGTAGEGIGPDLTNLSKRFKRVDTLSKMLFPSKTISDQYRGSMIITKAGAQLSGLAAVQGDVVTVLQSDGNKVTLKKADVEQQIASLVSVMPEKLLDTLTKQEIADLFAFLESEPPSK